MDPRPQPAQRPIPILVGGHSETALDRAARLGDGWISAPTSAGRLAELVSALERRAEAHGRSPDGLYKVAATTYSDSKTFAQSYDDCRRLGIDHLQVLVPGNDPGLVISRFPEVAAVSNE